MSTALPLPLTVSVAHNGSVSIEHPGGMIGMSRFSECARRLTLELGAGTHEIRTAQDVEDVPSIVADLTAALN